MLNQIKMCEGESTSNFEAEILFPYIKCPKCTKFMHMVSVGRLMRAICKQEGCLIFDKPYLIHLSLAKLVAV